MRSVRITDRDNKGVACKLYVFSDKPGAAIASNAAFALAVGELDKLEKIIAVSSFETAGSGKWARVDDVNIDLDADYRKLWAYLVLEAGTTYTVANPITVTCYVWPNVG